jgi:hypothetical protein
MTGREAKRLRDCEDFLICQCDAPSPRHASYRHTVMPAKIDHEILSEAFFIWTENTLGLKTLEDYAQKHDKVLFLDAFARLFAERYRYACEKKHRESSFNGRHGSPHDMYQRDDGHRVEKRVAAWKSASEKRYRELTNAVQGGLYRRLNGDSVVSRWNAELRTWRTYLEQPDGASVPQESTCSRDSLNDSVVSKEVSSDSLLITERSEETDDQLN